MPIFPLRITPEEIIRLVRADAAAAGGQPEFYLSAYHDYIIEEDYDRSAYGLADGNEYDLVTTQAVLTIEPRLEQNYWVLSIVVRKELGPQAIEDENALLGTPLSLDAFRTRFLAPGAGMVSVRLETRTPQGRQHFDRWWAELNARHPPVAAAGSDAPDAAPPVAAARSTVTADDPPATAPWTYRSREVVAAFTDPDALEAAVNALELAGFDRARISVLGAGATIRERIGRLYRSAAEIADDGRAPRSMFVSRDERVEGEAAAVAVPFYFGGLAGAAAVVSSGGALAAAIAGTILGGAVGAGLGGLVALAVARHHAARVAEQLAQGGLVLWVGVRDQDAEARALAVLQTNGGTDVHVHEVERRWGPADRPMSDAWVDPFLHPDPPA